MKYRDTASFGKRQEYSVIAELLKRDFDVYMTLVDDQGIDCVVRLDETRYVDVQIKARSDKAIQWNTFARMDFEPRPNLFFIFYTEWNKTFWVVPSMELVEFCYQNKKGKNALRRTLNLPKNDWGFKATKFSKYVGEEGFKLLKSYVLTEPTPAP